MLFSWLTWRSRKFPPTKFNACGDTCGEWIDDGHGTKTSWQHDQLLTVLASNSSHCYLANGVLNTNILLSHATCPSLCRCSFVTRKIVSEIDPVYIIVCAVPCPWAGLLSRNSKSQKSILRAFSDFPQKLVPLKITRHTV